MGGPVSVLASLGAALATHSEDLFAMSLTDRLHEPYRAEHAPLLGMAVCQVIGTLAMLALYTDRTRPTVAEALKLAVRGSK